MLLHGFPTSSHMFRDLIAAAGRTATISSRRTCRDSASPMHLTATSSTTPSTPGQGHRLLHTHYRSRTLRDLRLRLRRAGRLPPGSTASGAGRRDHLAKRQRLRGGLERGLESRSRSTGGSRHPGIEPRCVRCSLRRRPNRSTFTAWQTRRWWRRKPTQLDSALLARPGNSEIQLDLFLDYASNVALYPKFQEYFRAKRPRLLAVWGKSDPFFLPPGLGVSSVQPQRRSAPIRRRSLRAGNASSRNCRRHSGVPQSQANNAGQRCVRMIRNSEPN